MSEFSVLTRDVDPLAIAILVTDGDVPFVVGFPFGCGFGVNECADWCISEKQFDLALFLLSGFSDFFYDVS